MSKTTTAARSTNPGNSTLQGPNLRWPLLALLAVLCVVTLTRLELFAVYENERDALRLLARLSSQLDQSNGWHGEAPLQSALGSLQDLPRGTQDAEWLEGGRLLRWHGYLFALSPSAAGTAQLCAWPWKHGQTGVAAYASAPGLGLVGHANPAAAPGVWAKGNAADSDQTPVGPWSGLEHRPSLDLGAPPGGWQRVPAEGWR